MKTARVINTTTTTYQGKYHGYFSVRSHPLHIEGHEILPSKADPCIWLRKAPNLRCYEYIAVYVDDLCISAESPSAIFQSFKSKNHLKVKGGGRLTYHLGADYFEDPDGTFVSQPKKYDKLSDTYKRLFNDDPPKGYKTSLDKNDHPELDTSEILGEIWLQNILLWQANFNGWLLWGDLTSMLK